MNSPILPLIHIHIPQQPCSLKIAASILHLTSLAFGLLHRSYSYGLFLRWSCSLLLPCGLHVHGLAAIPTKFHVPYAQTFEGSYLCHSKASHFFSSICSTKSLQTSKLVDGVVVQVVERRGIHNHQLLLDSL